jgi:hypothetical protein
MEVDIQAGERAAMGVVAELRKDYSDFLSDETEEAYELKYGINRWYGDNDKDSGDDDDDDDDDENGQLDFPSQLQPATRATTSRLVACHFITCELATVI